MIAILDWIQLLHEIGLSLKSFPVFFTVVWLCRQAVETTLQHASEHCNTQSSPATRLVFVSSCAPSVTFGFNCLSVSTRAPLSWWWMKILKVSCLSLCFYCLTAAALTRNSPQAPFAFAVDESYHRQSWSNFLLLFACAAPESQLVDDFTIQFFKILFCF